MLDDASLTDKLQPRVVSHLKVNDTSEVQTKFYAFGNLLGRGAFGTVVLGIEKGTNLKWAIKIINKAQSGTHRVKLIEREINILRIVQHPNIIFLERVLESPKTLFLVFELCEGELTAVFRDKKYFSEDETRTIMKSLLNAVAYLHSHDVVHRDIKLENILVSQNPHDPNDHLFIKLTDFGLSVIRGGVGRENMLQEQCGTLCYMAPELLTNRMYSQQCDVWSMGVIMYQLLCGELPFMSSNERKLCALITDAEPEFNRFPWKENHDKTCVSLIKKMLTKNPAFRITAAEAHNNPWFGRSTDTPYAGNAMELMRLWKDDMREPNVEYREPSSGRSSLLNTLRSAGMADVDDRKRQQLIKQTFGDVRRPDVVRQRRTNREPNEAGSISSLFGSRAEADRTRLETMAMRRDSIPPQKRDSLVTGRRESLVTERRASLASARDFPSGQRDVVTHRRESLAAVQRDAPRTENVPANAVARPPFDRMEENVREAPTHDTFDFEMRQGRRLSSQFGVVIKENMSAGTPSSAVLNKGGRNPSVLYKSPSPKSGRKPRRADYHSEGIRK